MIYLLVRFISCVLIVALAMIIYKNRGNNKPIVIILFILSLILFILNFIL